MINFRKANLEDIPQIRGIAYAVWPVTYGKILSEEQMNYMLEMFYDPASLTAQMNDMGHDFIVAMDDTLKDKIIGFASFSTEGMPGIFHLHKLYVLGSFRGRGIGKELIRRVISNILHKEKSTALRLNVNRKNDAIGFYKGMGFRIVAEQDNDIGCGFFMNDYVMEKMLTR